MPQSDAPAFPAGEIFERLNPADPYPRDWCTFRHRQQGEFLHNLTRYAGLDTGLSHVGLSDEGRVLHTLRFGNGGRRVLLWARQHGDEPDCSAALALVLSELLTRSQEPAYQFILDRLDIAVFPMVNPDGVARFTRRNALGIDINRDAVAQASVEAQALMKIRESFGPEFAFNLHDMSPRKSTRDGNLVALAFQASPFDDGDTDNESRLKAKAVIGRMAEAAAAHAPGHHAKYTADYMHRAFGDTMMRLGVSCMLVEAGGWPEEDGGNDFLRRLYALVVLRGLYAIAAEEDQPLSGAEYDKIPFDSGRRFYDRMLTGAQVLSGLGRPPFCASVALNIDRVAGLPHDPLVTRSNIENIGDLGDELAIKRLDYTDHLILPGLMAVAPALRFREPGIPSADDARPFLDAGVTTLACGFGPFESARAREAWLERAEANSPPLQIIAFERVPHLRDIHARHGLTEFAGMLVQDLMISSQDLLNFSHLYHPAQHSAIEEEHATRMIGLDIFFQMGSSANDTHLHLHLTHLDREKGMTPVRSEDLRLLVDGFLCDPSQVTMSQDATERGFDWLPIMIGFGGLGHGRRPERNFFGRILQAYGAEETSGLVATLNMMMLNNARAFRLENLGRVSIGQRADFAIFQRHELEDPEAFPSVQPAAVFLNGRAVAGTSISQPEAAAGNWFFTARPEAR